MSLYKSTSDSVRFNLNPVIKSRPNWLNRLLVIATGYTLICLLLGITNNYLNKIEHDRYIARAKEINEPLRRYPDAYSQMNEIVERSEAAFEEGQFDKFISQAIHLTLVIASILYFFTGLKILGFYVAGLWTISFFVIIFRIFEIDVGHLESMYFVITLAFNRLVGLGLILLQTLLFMGLYFYSTIKFSHKNSDNEIIESSI